MTTLVNNDNINERTRKITEYFQKEFYQEFIERGKDFTEGYLSSFGRLGAFFAENYFHPEESRYNAARRALEDMTKDSN